MKNVTSNNDAASDFDVAQTKMPPTPQAAINDAAGDFDVAQAETSPTAAAAILLSPPPVAKKKNLPLSPVRLPTVGGDGDEAPDDPVEVPAMVLPSKLDECFELLSEIEDTPAPTRKEKVIKRAKLRILKKHIFAMQQAPAAPAISANDAAKINRARNSYHDRMAVRLQELAAKHPAIREAIAASKI